ncbi:MAG: GAF domain-containing sensor histidine kinase, partial [Anaerolineae bacterium]|nr:GAF domain-containing sensor histidine kinase [Anaerolineae bacterium]
TLELEPLLRFIMDSAAELTGAQVASILLIDNKTQELYFMAFASESDVEHSKRLKRIPVPLNRSIAGAIVQENTAIMINDVTTDSRHYRVTDDKSGFLTHSLLGVPMRIKERVIGVLEAVNKLNGNWTPDDQHYLEILASQAAVAIENASLVAKLRNAYQDLSQIDKIKNDFISIASHELRTPLGVILGYASFLKEESQGEASEHADAVLNSATKMQQIIEDMVQLRYLKVGESELDNEDVLVSDVMMGALNGAQSAARAKDLNLQYRLPTTTAKVRVDRYKMGMALTNVLNNAIKFSPPKTPIMLGYEMRDQEIWIYVNDQGIGIAPEHLDRIFDSFFQVEDHMTRRHGGMGLGLSIAKAVVEAQRGRIWADSAGENQGATFYISLPLIKG